MPAGEETAAEDRAYGLVGGFFLLSGFFLQLLGQFIDTNTCATVEVAGALVTAVTGIPLAVVGYRKTHPLFLRRLFSERDGARAEQDSKRR